jgi:hypothetical protein
MSLVQCRMALSPLWNNLHQGDFKVAIGYVHTFWPRIIKLALSPAARYGYAFAAVGAAFNFPLPGWRSEVPVGCIFITPSQANTLLNVLEYKR